MSFELKRPAKVILGLLAFGVLYGVYYQFSGPILEFIDKKVAPAEKQAQSIPKDTFKHTNASVTAPTPGVPDSLVQDHPLRVGVVTWGGYAGGEYFNEGFEASENSRYFKQFGIKVEFKLIDDFNNSREAWKSDNVDVLWITADSFPTEVDALKAFEPKIIFQADWSRGGDAIVVRRGISSVADLKGKTVAVAEGTPSNTFLLWLLEAGDMAYTDVNLVKVSSAIDAAAAFKSGKVDAAVVWSPDDDDCVNAVKGASVLKSTRQASSIIADVFYVKNKFLKGHRAELKALMEGWFIGAAEINNSKESRAKAAKILAAGLNEPEAVTLKAIENARLTTYGDNIDFFNLQGNPSGVHGEDLYNAMAIAYNKINLAPAHVPTWRQVVDTSLLSELNMGGSTGQGPEGGVKFSAPTEQQAAAPAITTKRVSINFTTGVAELDENSKYIIQLKFGDIAKGFSGTRIRIEGNTDNVGSPATNKALSLKRAQSVVNFLVKEYRFDKNRFIVVGNGSTKPVADNATADGRAKNRRTDFELLD
jgi:NitT/TauT family transport system substrate-binding protein